ncbi:MAG: hypothetical protein ABIG66_05070 [Candidatus Kerfeldbacteria bacterium]
MSKLLSPADQVVSALTGKFELRHPERLRAQVDDSERFIIVRIRHSPHDAVVKHTLHNSTHPTTQALADELSKALKAGDRRVSFFVASDLNPFPKIDG